MKQQAIVIVVSMVADQSWIAQLGGFLARKHDGEPGVKTLWQGLWRLHDVAQRQLVSLFSPTPVQEKFVKKDASNA